MGSTTFEPQPRLSDEFWWLAHHHATGRPLLGRRFVSVGLAAGLLGELLAVGCVAVRRDCLVARPVGPPGGAVAASVFASIARERHAYPVSVWLTVLAEHAYEQVAGRLHRAGQVRRRVGFAFRPMVWTPTDVNVAGWPWARLLTGAHDRRWVWPGDPVLAGLVWATGLDRHLLDGTTSREQDFFRTAVRALPSPMGDLVCATHANVGRFVMAHGL